MERRWTYVYTARLYYSLPCPLWALDMRNDRFSERWSHYACSVPIIVPTRGRKLLRMEHRSVANNWWGHGAGVGRVMPFACRGKTDRRSACNSFWCCWAPDYRSHVRLKHVSICRSPTSLRQGYQWKIILPGVILFWTPWTTMDIARGNLTPLSFCVSIAAITKERSGPRNSQPISCSKL